jgi:hypothetical protein
MSIEVMTVTLPAYWASALINGDASGMDDEEEVLMNAACEALTADGWYIVDVARDDEGEACEPWFSWSYRLYGGDASGGDVLDYIAHRQVDHA